MRKNKVLFATLLAFLMLNLVILPIMAKPNTIKITLKNVDHSKVTEGWIFILPGEFTEDNGVEVFKGKAEYITNPVFFTPGQSYNVYYEPNLDVDYPEFLGSVTINNEYSGVGKFYVTGSWVD